MRDGDDFFDDCDGWTEASLIRRLSDLPRAGDAKTGAGAVGPALSPSIIFDLATHGKVADLQRALIGRAGGNALPRTMPDLFSTVGLLEASWKNREISFGEAIRGLFTIRAVVSNLQQGRIIEASSQLFFGSGLLCVVDGDQHDLGAQIVAEKLYVSGWRTEIEVRGGFDWLRERARARHYDFVGVSVGTDEGLSGLADRIAEVREASLNRSVDVILGGAAFAYSASSFDFLGADFVAASADEAVSFLNERLKTSRTSLSH